MIDDLRQQEFDKALRSLVKWTFFIGVVVGAMLAFLVVKFG